MQAIYQKIVELQKTGKRAALCTIFRTSGPTPRKVGAKMLVLEDESIIGTIGGGALEYQVIRDAVGVIRTKAAKTYEHHLKHDHGMCCGGNVEVLIEPILSRKKLHIFGAGHVGKSLARISTFLQFDVTMIDERDGIFDDVADLDITAINKHHRRAVDELVFDEDTFIAVMTFDHAYDREIIAHCARQPHAYLGMIGSKRKVGVARQTFRAGNMLTEEEMNAIDWPMGIDIEVETPEEIAVAILAKMIDVRSKMATHHALQKVKSGSIAS